MRRINYTNRLRSIPTNLKTKYNSKNSRKINYSTPPIGIISIVLDRDPINPTQQSIKLRDISRSLNAGLAPILRITIGSALL